jgi:hypothetical protein
MPGAAFAGIVCALVIALAVGMLISAVLLRASIALYNKLAGGASSPSGVPDPTFGKAMWITFATSLAQVVIGFLFDVFTGPGTPTRRLLESLAGDMTGGAGERSADLVVQILFLPVSLLIMAVMLSAKLPTTFGRAMLISLCYLLIVVLVVGVIAVIGIVVYGVVLRGA